MSQQIPLARMMYNNANNDIYHFESGSNILKTCLNFI
jgi:hypothetical protein